MNIENGALVPTVEPQIFFDESDTEPTSGDREILLGILGLVCSPAPAKTAAARCAMLYKIQHPEFSRAEILHRFPGVRKSEFNAVRFELASLLSAQDKDVKQTITIPTATVSEKSISKKFSSGNRKTERRIT